MATKELKIFCGNANRELAQEIADYLGISMGVANVKTFMDGEINIGIDESVRGADVFVVQPTCAPTNDSIMELLILIDALRRASAYRITAVVPYYGYARQERKTKAREPITAKLMANLITTAGADRLVAMDLHAPAIQGFFDIPVDHLPGVPILAEYFMEKKLEDICVVSPDIGGVGRARNFAERIGASLAIVDKRRPEPNVSKIMHVIGDLQGKIAVLIDDITDTGGTITQAAAVLMEKGAKEVYACCTHPVLSGPAIGILEKSVIKEFVVTNTIPLTPEKKIDKIKVLSVAPLLGEAIVRIHEDLSVSKLFS
ncbi:MAG: ribose-phosphate pyrophosphokinase [Dehalobacter sp. 4CP]|jgi:ribose-phosphate pyrophosphokinase|uniref:Ribose-phosphate pyrophosphokinase n=2 Tax=Dehalobacter restrictus TaxID=55583 RepID=A0A857DGK9_9FIRM|nr:MULTISPECIES: ribose-phosphate pyrophosphokinase [Dehalobacter]NBJ16094.1 ribose-phosphate pyrophosphokinase [Dehalobacter sp. 4CP]AHF08878.1 ribose-phosphate pyrophosphokinase [Dehalobacter restrictus DSM 9455]MCG1025726.1 ribose-phosphate pyrophosphokinase [Dehalobacter sp.]MCM1565070.1 ribose-phosphate pyrophosphokinase [Dehalobacter sp.]MDJ0305460.1 ribose-phosphate pyrophosphokinase [Dehalobacter sp.]